MNFIFNREESAQEIILVQKPYMLYFFLMVIACYVLATQLPQMPVFATLYSMVWYGFIGYAVIDLTTSYKTRKEINSAMKAGKVEVTGSKFSFSNPTTYRIKKD